MHGKLDSGQLDAKGWFSNGDLFKNEDAKWYKTLDQYTHGNPSQVSNFVSHSKGSSVVDRRMENRPALTGRARLHAKPHIDVIGLENSKDYLN